MNIDKRKLYTLSSIILVILLSMLFFPKIFTNIGVALVLIPLALLTYFLIKKRSVLSINKKQVTWLMGVIGLVYVALLYISGIFFGMTKNIYSMVSDGVFRYILPLTAIVVSIEIIRWVMLAQNNKIVTVLTYLACICVDVMIYSNLNAITSFNGFMDVVGIALLPAVTSNLLYTFTSKRYGCKPNILYRLIITLYIYIINIVPAIPDVIDAFIKLVIPLVVYKFIDVLYERQVKINSRKSKRLSYVSTGVAAAVLVSVVMLISCQFRFGLMVIGSESMTGEINKGDAIIYERYDNQIIEEGDVIVFEKDGLTIIHRVVDIERINNQNRYYTKGDANEFEDNGYITDVNIIGVTNIKIAYIGYPTIWIRDAFKK